MKSKKSKATEPELCPRFRIKSGKKIAFGPGKAELLELVAETGSIGDAARRMGMSYMRAWTLIQTMNACFTGPVIEAVRGGHERGGAELTATGRRVLEIYQRMETDSRKACRADWKSFQKLLCD